MSEGSLWLCGAPKGCLEAGSFRAVLDNALLLPKLFWCRCALSRSTVVPVGIKSPGMPHVSSTQWFYQHSLHKLQAVWTFHGAYNTGARVAYPSHTFTLLCGDSLQRLITKKMVPYQFQFRSSAAVVKTPRGRNYSDRILLKQFSFFTGQDKLSFDSFVVLPRMHGPVLSFINLHYSGKFRAIVCSGGGAGYFNLSPSLDCHQFF